MKKLLSITFFLLSSLILISNASGKIREITLGFNEKADSNLAKAANAMKAELEKISNNTMTFKIFPGAQLGEMQEILSQVAEGEVDATIQGYPDLSFIIPELKLIGEPYVIKDYDHLLKVIDSEYGKRMNSEIEKKGIHLINVWYFGTRQTSSNKPINSIADFKGLKFRVPYVDFLLDFAKAVGSIPVPVSYHEVYLALKTNQIDAEENPLSAIKVMKFNEVQKYIALTNHFIASAAVEINTGTWNSLTQQQQSWLQQAAEVGKKVNNDLVFNDEKVLLQEFQKQGIIITKPDLTPFRKAMQPYYNKLNELYGANSVEKIMNLQ